MLAKKDMPRIPNNLTGAAGEHLVAAQLSIRGFSVGLTRGGSRAVDMLASNADGSRSVAIQVKASCDAWTERKKKKATSHWSFMMSTSDIQKRTSALIYVFVCLKGQSADSPDYFVVPGDVVSRRLEEKYRLRNRKTKIRMLDIFEHEKESFHGRWDIIENALN
jgi:hypothetical protein